MDAAPKLVNPPAPRILVTLEINVSGASVEVDGTPRQPNKKGLLIFKKPGEKTIRVEKNGYLPQMFKLDLKKGERRTVSVNLMKKTPTLPPPRAKAPTPWYKEWWVWTVVTGVVVTAVGVTVPLMVYEKKAPSGTMGSVSYP